MDQEELTATFARLGARDPEQWAASEIQEGIAQLHRYVFLKGAWQEVVDAEDDSWIDRVIANTPEDSDAPFAGIAHALRRLLDAGADRRDVHDVVRGVQAELIFGLCYLLDDSDTVEGNDVVDWGLFELDEDEQPLRPITGLHESVLETDPTGREMRPTRRA